MSVQEAMTRFEGDVRKVQNIAIFMKNYGTASKGVTGSYEITAAADALLKAVQVADKHIQNGKKYFRTSGRFSV